MKILHIVPTYYPAFRYGGPIKSVHELNKWLVKKGVEVTVYTTDIDGSEYLNVPLKQEVIIDGVKVYYFPVSFRPWEYSYSLHLALSKNIKNFDVVHITSVFLSVSSLGAYYAKKFNKPYIISPRGSLMVEPLKRKSPFKKKIYISLIEKRNLWDSVAIHFTTEAEKEEYLKAGLPLKKGIIIPNGLDIQPEFQSYEAKPHKIGFREKFGISPDKKVILFLSRLNWKKGLDTLIPAFSEVIKEEPKAILVIAGGDEENYQKEVLRIIDKTNLRTSNVLRTSDVPNIVFTGMLLGKDKTAAYSESDVFVLPSYAENFGIVVIEAMYFGLPVIITKNVGISPSVEKSGAGIVIEKDEKQLTEAILRILNNPDLAKKIGERGKRLVETEFSWPEIASRFMEAYKNL